MATNSAGTLQVQACSPLVATYQGFSAHRERRFFSLYITVLLTPSYSILHGHKSSSFSVLWRKVKNCQTLVRVVQALQLQGQPQPWSILVLANDLEMMLQLS